MLQINLPEIYETFGIYFLFYKPYLFYIVFR